MALKGRSLNPYSKAPRLVQDAAPSDQMPSRSLRTHAIRPGERSSSLPLNRSDSPPRSRSPPRAPRGHSRSSARSHSSARSRSSARSHSPPRAQRTRSHSSAHSHSWAHSHSHSSSSSRSDARSSRPPQVWVVPMQTAHPQKAYSSCAPLNKKPHPKTAQHTEYKREPREKINLKSYLTPAFCGLPHTCDPPFAACPTPGPHRAAPYTTRSTSSTLVCPAATFARPAAPSPCRRRCSM